MTEHDTPSTAHTEAEYVPTDDVIREGHAFFAQARIAGATFTQGLTEFDRWIAARDEQTRAEVLAQVREGLKALRKVRVPVLGAYFLTVDRADALAVVDRLEGKQ